jgi:chromosome segregation and condensation protein ScpB
VTVDNSNLAAWARAVQATLWQAGHALTREELAAALDTGPERIDAVVDALIARGLVSIDAVEQSVQRPSAA